MKLSFTQKVIVSLMQDGASIVIRESNKLGQRLYVYKSNPSSYLEISLKTARSLLKKGIIESICIGHDLNKVYNLSEAGKKIEIKNIS
jgi:hypothetical protein